MQFGRSYEEFEVGATYKHWPGKTVTEYDDHLFCLLTMNHHPLHLDAHYAGETTQFGQNVVVGNYVYSILLGMSVPDVSGKAIANLEVESLRHVAPTFHGDTLYGETTVLDKWESTSKDDRGVVHVETIGYNQDGTVVCIFRRKVMVPKESYLTRAWRRAARAARRRCPTATGPARHPRRPDGSRPPAPLRWPRGDRPAHPLHGERRHRGPRRGRRAGGSCGPRRRSPSPTTTRRWAGRRRADAARAHGITLVPGIEVSCSRRWQSIHLLAYLPDPGDPELVAELERARESRDTRLDRMVAMMAADGIPVTLESVRAQVEDGATAGRPHIADALVAAGVVAHRDEAFARWLGNDSPYYVAALRARPGAGGRAGPGRRGSARHRAPVVGDAGPGGLRPRSSRSWPTPGWPASRCTTATTTRMPCATSPTLARALGLLVTGSSDYHGEGKLNRLGREHDDPGDAGGHRGAGDRLRGGASVSWFDVSLFTFGG